MRISLIFLICISTFSLKTNAQKLSLAVFVGISGNTDFINAIYAIDTFSESTINDPFKGTFANVTYGLKLETNVKRFSIGIKAVALPIVSRYRTLSAGNKLYEKYYLGNPAFLITPYINYNFTTKKITTYAGVNAGIFTNQIWKKQENFEEMEAPTLTIGMQAGAKLHISNRAFVFIEASGNYLTWEYKTPLMGDANKENFFCYIGVVGIGIDIFK